LTPWEAYDELKKARADSRTEQYCLHPSACPSTCGRVIARAHSVQLRGGLRRIARNGHVYRYSADPFDYGRPGKSVNKLIGIRNASTFPGFCDLHDNATFEPIDNEVFSATAEQCFLLGYRAIARAIFTKRREKKLIPTFWRISNEVPLNKRVAIQCQINAYESVGNLAVSSLELHKSDYDHALLSGTYSDIRFYVLRLKDTPDILCSGILYPEADFDGRSIQSGVTGTRLDLITYSLIATPTGGAIVFAWEAKSDESCVRLIRLLDSIPNELIPHAIVRLVFQSCENRFLSPAWWDGLDSETRDALDQHYLSSSNLLDDGLRAVSWEIISKQCNII
jgi:hypothetical protein